MVLGLYYGRRLLSISGFERRRFAAGVLARRQQRLRSGEAYLRPFQ